MKSTRMGLLLVTAMLAGAGMGAIALAGDEKAEVEPADKLLTGNAQGLWIIDNASASEDDADEKKTPRFSVLAKKVKGKWKRGASRIAGRIVGAAAIFCFDGEVRAGVDDLFGRDL